ncbi:MAG: 3-phosphoshikimate 1-carboxyvinyltransferase [Burkholderiaceae bacterium]|nr:3-phosphoshikimate 1-carboxyvinyltransferase [Burkholderiaceae bacterium]
MTAWPAVLTLNPIDRAAGAVRLPGSKSISNRALLLSALADGETTLINLLNADDTRVMRDALIALGVQSHQGDGELLIKGWGGRFPNPEANLFLGNAGTAFRSLTAALAFSGGHYQLNGVARMRERPIADLVDALNLLGARIRYTGARGFPPLVIEAAQLVSSDSVSIKADVSSQFLSGLLMTAPLVAPAHGLRIFVDGDLISEPYVALTCSLMQCFGVRVAQDRDGYTVPRSHYKSPGRFVVEGDASSASYFLALGAIAGGPVRVDGVGKDSAQGDVRFADALAEMGAQVEFGAHHIEVGAPADARLRAIDVDCNHIPDAAMTLAIVALFAGATSTLRNIGSWRVKETDRIAAMATELRKVGALVEDGQDWICITPPKQFRGATIDTYDDHRMAMCFSLVAAGGVQVHIRDPQCVGKTFPDYFERLAELTGR